MAAVAKAWAGGPTGVKGPPPPRGGGRIRSHALGRAAFSVLDVADAGG